MTQTNKFAIFVTRFYKELYVMSSLKFSNLEVSINPSIIIGINLTKKESKPSLISCILASSSFVLSDEFVKYSSKTTAFKRNFTAPSLN